MNVALSWLDISIMLGYVIGVVGLGMWLSRGIKSSKDYFLAGKSLPWWAVGMSLVVSDIGAKDMVGLAADGYRWGMVMMNYDFIGCAFPLLVAAFLFMPFLWVAGVCTIPEYLGRRYSPAVRAFFAVIWAFFMMGTVGTIFACAAVMFEGLLGWNFWVSIAVTGVAVALFTTTGGLKAVVITDAVSCVVLIVGATLICIIGLNEAGGWFEMRRTIGELDWAKHHFQFVLPTDHPEYPWPAVLLGLGFVLGPAYWIGNQAIVQRSFGTKSAAHARASYLFCAVIKLFFPFLLVVPGLIGLALFHDKLGTPMPGADWDGNRVLPMVVQLLPRGVVGVVFGAFMAGVLSNLDSYVNSASTLVVTDLYRPLFPLASDRQCLAVGRWLVIVLLAGGAGASYLIRANFGSVFEAFQVFLSTFQGPLLVLMLLGMLTSRATNAGALAGMTLGVGAAVVMHLPRFLGGFFDFGFGAIPFLWVAWWSFVVALVVTSAVSLFTKPYDRSRLAGLVCWIPPEKEASE